MILVDIASILFVCVTANHLGLIKAIEAYSKIELPVINCPKCSTFWLTFAYSIWSFGFSELPLMLAISFLASYSAIWLELFEGFIDSLYMKCYEKIYPGPKDDTTSADADKDNPAGSVS